MTRIVVAGTLALVALEVAAGLGASFTFGPVYALDGSRSLLSSAGKAVALVAVIGASTLLAALLTLLTGAVIALRPWEEPPAAPPRRHAPMEIPE